MPLANDITEERLRELAQVRADGETVLSLYLNLDPSEFATPRARASEADSLLDGCHREIEQSERPHAELMALRTALGQAREALSDVSSLAQGARSLALFAGVPFEEPRALRLPHPVQSAAVISDEPFIAPLLEEGVPGRTLVVLVDERFARVLVGSGDVLREATSFGDDVHGRTDKGGWSQARYQRSVHEDVEGHLRHLARILKDLLKVAPYDALLIACAQPLWPRVLERLHPDVRARLLEPRLELDVSDAGIEDVEQAAAAALARARHAHEDEVLAALREHYGREDGRAAAGLADVLHALVERRVEVLLLDAGMRAPGVLCPRGDWMDVEGDQCPVDGTPLEQRQDIIEDALLAAAQQSAEVLALHDRPDLAPLGGIAATLRF
jgi:peptide subunit release factor 1 (eRF1)